MKNPIAAKAFLLLLLLTSISTVFANTYYFSSSTGNDSYTQQQAQNGTTPWRSLSKLAQIAGSLNSGDVVLFLRNDVFYGQIPVYASGVSYGAYGLGNDPVISGLTTLSGWTSAGNNIWETTVTGGSTSVGTVLVNGLEQRIGRYPNATASNGGYLTIDSYSGNTSITGNDLSSTPNWTGGEVVIRKTRWVLDRNIITVHSGNTINYTSASGYNASGQYGFFIQNHPAALDLPGEWYYRSSTKRLGIYSTGNPSSLSIQASAVEILVPINGQNNLTFDHLVFTGANTSAFDIKNGSAIRITNCSLLHSGSDAIDASGTAGLTVENTTIDYAHNVACNADNCNGLVVRNCVIRHTGTFPGMGRGDSGSYEAILASGDNQTFELNTIDSTGYVPITFRGNTVTIKNNIINNYAFVKDDGGAIYTWNNIPNAAAAYGRVVSGNIIRNGKGAPEGTDAPGKTFAHGIYLDDNTTGVTVSGNTVASCGGFGLYVHNARDNIISNNSFYDNDVQISMIHDEIAPNCFVTNNTVTGNTFFSLQAAQPVAEYKTSRNDLSGFGTFDNNYYCRPIDDNAVINTLRQVNGSYIYLPVDLGGWKAMYAKDASSKRSPRTLPPYTINSVTGANQMANGSFSSNINGLYAYSPANNCTVSWNNGALDGGTLQVGFSGITGSSKGTVIIGIGAVTAGKKYVLRFSLKGPDEHKMLELYLRKSLAPYNDLTSRQLFAVGTARTENEYVFVASGTSTDASIGIDIPEQGGPVYLDNIRLMEVNATAVNPADSVRLLVNETRTTQQAALNGTYIDLTNTAYSGNVSIDAFSSKVFLGAPSGTAVIAPVNCSATGSILREQWDNIDGNDVGNIPLTATPSSSGQLISFEGPRNAADRYGSRIRGYICPPLTGNYTFWIAGDDATELWLSNSNDPSAKIKIAYSLSWTEFREWNKLASQRSVSIYLQAGQKYYVEALQKEGGGGDHVSVAWQLPDGTMEAPIPGNRLAPYIPSIGTSLSQAINFPALTGVTLGQAPVTLLATASSGLPVSFSIVSGPAILSGNVLTPSGAGSIVIKASQAGNGNYGAAPDVMQTLVVSAPAACSATGSILREQWSGIAGNDVANIPLATAPSASSQLTTFEGPHDAADYYGSRIRGYICPPQTGNYVFWIAGDDGTELWLSSSDDPSGKTRIAYSLSWTNFREWNKFSTQRSASIYLQAGQKYYIEALQKEGNGGDHLSVAWQLPDGTMEAPVPGSRLSPYTAVAAGLLNQTITFPALGSLTLGQASVTLNATASSGLPVTYTIVSGPGTLQGNVLTPGSTGTIVIRAMQNGNTLYNAAAPVTQSLTVFPAPCSATGSILREQWNNVDGNDVSNIPLYDAPSASGQLTSFEGPRDAGDRYGSRIRGYICPPLTGNYTFWIAGDDGTELWLSNGSDPSNKTRIAYSLSWTDFREWNKFSTQKSVSVYLQSGQKYYIEALQKEGGGGDHVSVAWQLPDGTMEAPIPGNRLSPYQPGVNSVTSATALAAMTATASAEEASITHQPAGLSVYPNPARQTSIVQMTPAVSGLAKLGLYDLQGRLIRELFSGYLYGGSTSQVGLNASHLTAGTYIIKLHTASGDQQCRTVVAR